MRRQPLAVFLACLLIATGGASCLRAASVVISEFMAINSGPLADENGDFSDWIELRNVSSNSVNLQGWYLTDKANNLTKWSFPATNIAPGQFLIVFASEKNRRVAGQPLHTNFKLDGAGEYLGLIRPDGVTVESAFAPTYPQQYDDISYGAADDNNTTLVAWGGNGKFLVPNFRTSEAWIDRLGFNDADWRSGNAGVGYQLPLTTYAPYLQTTVNVGTVSCYARFTFTLTGAEEIDALALALRFEDGFVAYLNGVKVAESNAPAVPAHDSTATVARASAAALSPATFDISHALGALEDGANVLAIHAMNVASSSTDLLLSPHLLGISTNPAPPPRYYTVPTPGAANATGHGLLADTPDFSLPAGFYTNAQSLTLSAATPGAVIRYSLDGDEPTESSPAYTAPLTIASRAGQANPFSLIPLAPTPGQSQWGWIPHWVPPAGEVFKATVVRARTFAPGRAPSPIVTQSYFVDTNMFARYGHLPVISLTSDEKHLFDPVTGIMVPGVNYVNRETGNYYKRWEKPCHFELFESNGVAQVSQGVGIRIQGNTSCASPQKGLSIFAREEYGKGEVDYPLFATARGRASQETSFDRFMLRAWGSFRGRALIYDTFSTVLLDHLDEDLQNYRPCIVFVNGEYWGLQEIREANKNSHYLEQYHGVDRNDPGYDVLYGMGPYSDYDPDSITDYSYIDEGDATNWNALISFLFTSDMSHATNYAYARTQIDVDAFMLYMIHSMFVVKYDWPNQNEAKFRPRTPDGKWRWLQFDMDHGFQDPYTTDMLYALDYHNVCSRLEDNAEFRRAFVNRYTDLLNTAFRPDVMLARFEAMVAELMPFAPELHNRYPVITGGGTQMSNWQTHLNSMRNNVANRSAFERGQLRTRFGLGADALLTLGVISNGQGRLRINLTELDAGTPGFTNGVYPWAGVYYTGVPMTCTAIPADGYRFAGWQGLSTSTTNPLPFTLTGPGTLTATFAPFDPASFPLRITEVMAHPAMGAGVLASNEAEFIELFNAGVTPLELRDVSFTEGIAFTFTNSHVLPPGGYAVLANNATAFAARYPSVPLAGMYTGSLDNNGETLRLKATPYGPTLASFTTSDGREWPVSADGAGHSLVPLAPSDATDPRLSLGAWWRASTFRFGSPGAADPAPLNDIVLNEVMAHTDFDDPVNHPGYDSNDWLELFNLTATPRGLADWYLSDDPDTLKKWAIPAGTTIAAEGWRVFDEITGFHAPLTNGFGLNKAGERVFLSYLPGTAADRVADAVRFKGQDNGATLGRYVDGAPGWQAMAPTRGTANGQPATRVVISELMAAPAAAPGTTGDTAVAEFIELWNPGTNSVTFLTEAGAWRLSGGVTFTFPTNVTLPPGGYLAVVGFDPVGDSAARAAFLAAYGQTNGQAHLLGPYDGRLADEGERLALERPQLPDQPGDDVFWVIEDEVFYAGMAPWPDTGTSGTRSIRRITPLLTAGVQPNAWLLDLFPSPGLAPTLLAIAAPAAGGQYLLPHVGTVAAAVDEGQVVGTLTGITFYQNGTSLGTAAAPPYALPLTTVTAPGTYVFDATLQDGAGAHHAAPISIEALALDNAAGATDVTESAARLQGLLTGNGTVSATFFWGTTDGGTNPAAWDRTEAVGNVGPGAFTRDVGGLVLGQRYFYRTFAANAYSSTWAPASTTFRTGYDAWSQRMHITISGLTDSEPLLNFPVLIALSTNIAGFNYGDFGSPAGADLRFAVSSNAPALPHELDAWNVAGTSYAWVRMPVVPPGATSIWAYWGNPTASLPAAATNGSAWAPAAARVFHLQGTPGDSTSNRVTGVDSGTVAAAGIVGEGRYFDGATDAIDPLLPAAWYGTNIQALTLGLWVRPETGNNATVIGAWNGGNGFGLFMTQAAGQWKAVVRNPNAPNTEHAVLPAAWQLLTLVLDQGQARIYRNGQPAAASIGYVGFTPVRDLLLGMMHGQSGAEYRYRGTMDDVRIEGAARSAAWVRASYLTVVSNSLVTAYAVGDADMGDRDSDGDGLVDDWERRHFGSTSNPSGAPGHDGDGDGLNNDEEFAAGTDPTNQQSVFRLELVPSGTTWRVTLFGVAADGDVAPRERYYAIESTTNLMMPLWQGILNFTNVRGANGLITATNAPPAGPPTYYRGRVWLGE